MSNISSHRALDRRFDLEQGAGSDAVHVDPQYGYAVTELFSDSGKKGTGIAYTLGGGTNLICEAIELLIQPILGRDI
jgi:L-fuconate dehydratase